jgi:hypothetical protein
MSLRNFSKRVRTACYGRFDLHALETRAQRRREAIARADASVEFPVVTLTTVPSRIRQLKPTLVSLLRQTLPPLAIHLNVGDDLFRGVELPAFLTGLKLTQVHRVPRDVGPATKYIPTLERYQGSRQLIVVVDDDMYYARSLLSDLAAAERGSQGRKVFCANGFNVPADLQSASRPSDKALDRGRRRVAIVEGCGGYTLRPDFVDPADLRNLADAPPRALFDDDIWLSGHLSRAGVVKVQISTGRRKSLLNTVESAISGNRAQLQTDLMEHFRQVWSREEIHPVTG